MSSKATSSPVWASVRFCAIRCPVFPLSWWNRTVFLLTAEYSFTGTLTSPKEIAPLHIDRGMGPILLPRGAKRQRPHARLRDDRLPDPLAARRRAAVHVALTGDLPADPERVVQLHVEGVGEQPRRVEERQDGLHRRPR